MILSKIMSRRAHPGPSGPKLSPKLAPKLPRESLTQSFALVVLLGLGAWALVSPGGLLALTENAHMLAQRKAEVAALTTQRDVLRNRVDLLDPAHADPDLVGELLRKDLNVAHPDEMVIARH